MSMTGPITAVLGTDGLLIGDRRTALRVEDADVETIGGARRHGLEALFPARPGLQHALFSRVREGHWWWSRQ
jgi:hypothetical protein